MPRLQSVIVCLALVSVSAAAWCGEYINPKTSPARQKENDWIMIERYEDLEIRPEKFAHTPEAAATLRELGGKNGESTNIRLLIVQVQFLKQCEPTTISKRLETEVPNSPMSTKLQKVSAYIGSYVRLLKKGDEKRAERYRKQMLDEVPDLEEMIDKYYSCPLYDCSYKTKVNATYFGTSGDEIRTDSEYPVANRIDEDNQKLTANPGDVFYLKFLVPEAAKAWDVWVSK